MNTDSVSLIEVLAAARRQHASLVVESSGYLLLAISRGMGGLAVDVDPAAMMLRTDGALTLTGPRARCAAEDAAHTLRQLAQRLLDVSIGKSTGLRAAIRPPEDGRNPLNGLITGVTKALIPLNRSAAKRALARLARETIRAKKRGQLRAEDIQREAEEIAAACARGPAVQTSAPAAARQESVYSSTPIPYSLPATSAHPAPSGLSQLDVDIEIELVTPTPPPADAAALELRTVTPPPVLAQPFSASVPLATTGLANTPTGSASSASCSDVHDRVTATEPDDFAARAARADGIADDDPDAAEAVRHSADTVALAAAVVDAAPAAAVAAFDAVDKEPDVLEEFRIEDDEDDMDADLKSDVSELVQCALSQVDDVDIAGADFSPLNDDVRYTPSPAAGEPADDASVEAMLAGFGGEGADEAVNRAADCLNEMMRLDVPARGREISAAERRVIASLNAHPSDAHAAPSSSAAAQPLEANTPSPEEPSPEVVVEFEEDEISL
ncbi:MAG TPA: hypothetical protein ENK23_09140, partial [Sorangium sp.]|nr:hypothetical protein [Sorangium sp.]